MISGGQPSPHPIQGIGAGFIPKNLHTDLLDGIASLAREGIIDTSRVAIMGGSYGGYMVLGVATNFPERIAGAVEVVGIANFVSFLESTESYRRDLRRVEAQLAQEPRVAAHRGADR